MRILKLIKSLSRGEKISSIEKFNGMTIIGDKNIVKIAQNVSFGGQVVLYATAMIQIGEHTMVGYRTIFHTATHNYENHPMWIERIDKPIKVGKHVWIGTNVTLLGGIIIGDFSVIGAGSVVTANVPERAIVGGNPAKILKYREIPIEKLKDASIKNYPIGSYITISDYSDKMCK